MSNISGNAYALTALCPLKKFGFDDDSPVQYTRYVLQNLPNGNNASENYRVSPIASVPNTYLARLFILDDTIFQGSPHEYDQLKSKYLAFVSEFHGDLDTYLRGMYESMANQIQLIWKFCVGFEDVEDVPSFIEYIKKCQVNTSFYFNGSTDDSLAEQLKSLYLKQEFSKFVFDHQSADPVALLEAYRDFDAVARPGILSSPTWKPGIYNLDQIILE